ncbi:hypothetical protein KUTeg_013901 [Tegillarca granosa]|uniref:Uncharacterized protein n=1 Tax=Tegillarca granosa TaxID=220873 RepID=A0ABQ9EZI1_TEGGR|nr:hypothetical protein KUTeg_013901 [Tegillarca granosa]
MTKDTTHSKLKREVEFRLLLIEACSDVSESVIKELYLYHSALTQHQHEQRIDHAHPLVLSSDLLRFLQKSLLEKPILGHALINSVLSVSEHSQFKKNNEVLQNLYIKIINSILDKLSDAQNEAVETETNIAILYYILSLYDPEPYQNYVPLRELFTNLLKTPHIDKKSIMSVLVGQKNTYLVEEFCKLDYEVETGSETQLVSGHHSDLTGNQKCIQLLAREPDRTKRLHMLFLLCIKKQQHLLKNVMIHETAISLIKNGMFTELKELLEPEEFHPLKPLLLLYGWSFCSSVTQAKALLEILWNRQFIYSLICRPLVSTEDRYSTPQSSINHQQRAADMFVGLENHSVLYVLHKSTRLASKNQQEVLNLLQNSPFEGQNGKKVKSVRFSEDGAKGHTMKDLQIERHKDTSIFNGFCAINNIMDVIYFCSEYQDTHLMKPLHVTDFPSAKHFDDFDETESIHMTKSLGKEGEKFQDIYKENVTVKLESTKVLLSKLQPLTFRVEILENIFSLLFLTREDIQESAITIDSDSGEVEESESSCRDSMNGGIRTSTISEESVSPTTPNFDGKFDNHMNSYFHSAQSETVKLETSYDEPYIDQSKLPVPKRKSEKSSSSSGNVITQNIEKSMKLKLAIFDSSRRGSGNASTLSLDSLSSSKQLGFLSNEYVVRDILAMLKECLVDLNAAKFRILGKKNELSESKLKTVKTDVSTLIDVKLEEPLSHIVQSSVTMETLSNKIAQLSQYVHEAQWRFNLVSHENIPKKPGEVLLEPITVSRDMWNEEIDLDSLTSEFSTKVRRRKRHTTSSSNEKAEEFMLSYGTKKHVKKNKGASKFLMVTDNKSSFSFDSPSETHSTDTTLDGEGRRKRRSRSRSRHRTRSKTNQQQPTGIIPLMLMLKLEDRSQSVEVDFTLVYNKAVKKLQGLNIGAHGHGTKVTKPGKMSMKALASVAAVGVATVSVTTIADELLSSSKLPRIPHPKSRVTIPAKLQLCFQQENCPTLILFDLFCTACRTWEMCNNMVDVLKIKQPKLSDLQLTNIDMKEQENDLESTKSVRIDQKMKSILDVVKQYENVLQLGAENESSQHHHGQNDVLVALYKHSIQTFLQTGTLSLNPSHCLKYADFVCSMRIKLEKVDYMFKTFGKMPLEGYMYGSSKTSPRSISSPKTSPKPSPTGKEGLTDKPVIHTAMKSLIQAMEKELPQGGLSQLYLRNPGEPFKNRDYLLNLYEHLKGLAFVVVESEAKNKESIVVPKNYFRMLDEGPIATLGRLMFSRKIQPASLTLLSLSSSRQNSLLEQVAKKLSLDLTQIIVHNCCSEIPSKQQRINTSQMRDIQRCNNKLCINSADCVQNVQNHSLPPDVTVRGILTKLLKLMKEEYREIINSTSKLELVDLESLKSKEEKICFFGNLQNLMCLHMNLFLFELLGSGEVNRMLSPKTVGGLTLKPYCEMSVIEQISYMNMFSYRVGQMGVISFFDLRYIINRNGLIAPLEFDGLLQNCLYEIDTMDPWYKYIPPPEPRLLFTLTSCSQSSPPVQMPVTEVKVICIYIKKLGMKCLKDVQILVPEMVNTQLNIALKEYLNHSVTVDKNRNTFTDIRDSKVTVPQLLMWYKQDFSFDHNETFIADNEGMIIFISEHTSGEVQSSNYRANPTGQNSWIF